MSQNCPFCKTNTRIKKNGTYTVFNEFSEKEVSRFFCRSCGLSFSEHTPESELSRKIKNGRLEVVRKKSNYRKEKETSLYAQITDYITSYGLPKIEEITDELRISSKTYYKYLRNMKLNLAGNFIEERKKLKPKEFLFLEIKKQHKKTGAKIRFLLLVELKSRVIFNYFFYQKKRVRKSKEDIPALLYEEKANLRIGYTFNSDHIEKFLINLKNTYPNLSIQLSCSDYLKNKLLKSRPDLFRNADRKILILLNSDFKDYGIDRVLSFTYTLQIKKYAKYASVPKSIYTREIMGTLETLISIYNKHQMELLLKESSKTKKSDEHRRRSKQKKSIHIVRNKSLKSKSH